VWRDFAFENNYDASMTDADSCRALGPFAFNKDGVASVSLVDDEGRKRIILQVTPDGTPTIRASTRMARS
jgi:hypothetical protein